MKVCLTPLIQTLVNQVLETELPALPQLLRTLEKSLTYLRSKRLLYGCKWLKVEQNHKLEEAICFFKQSDFEPNLRLRTTDDRQWGIHAGGLPRQFFTDLFLATSTGANGIPAFLDEYCRFSIIVQTGLCFSCLACSICYYICSGITESAVISL